MKKIISLIFVIVLCLSANVLIYSQNSKNNRIKKPVPTANLTLTNASAFSDGNGVYLRWQTEGESNILGFYVYRIGAKGNILTNSEIIPGGYLRTNLKENYYGDYAYFDPNGEPGNSYRIESLAINGKRQILQEVAPNYVSDLVGVAGVTSSELKESAENAVRSIENNELAYPGDLQKQFEQNVLPANLPMQRWVSSQPGVRIGVRKRGFYRVSRTELENAGFDVNAPGNLWQLFADGREQSIIVGANDSYIEFYGEGIDTLESDTKVYYLIAGSQNGQRIDSRVLRPLAGNVISNGYLQSFVRKDRALYFSSILNGDEQNYFGSAVIAGSDATPTTMTTTFNLSGINYNVTKTTFEVALQGLAIYPHSVQVTLNGEIVGNINWQGRNLSRKTFEITTSGLQVGTNTLQFKALSGPNDVSVIESIKVNFSRKYEAMQNQLSFYTTNYRKATVSGFTSPNIRVFDLTYPDSPSRIDNLAIENNGGNYSVILPSYRGKVVYAVEDSAIQTASFVKTNNPSSLATSAHHAEMIIVTHSDWMTQAQNWANYRISQGLSVEVIDVDDIFDEFSYGSVKTSAMTNFFVYAKNNWQTPPNYILLIGDSTYDFRNYSNLSFQSFVPTKLVDTTLEETGSDEALCDFNNDGLAEIAVGRISVRSPQQVTQILNKVMIFESTLPTALDRGALFVSDLPIGYDFEAVNTEVANQLPPNMPKAFIARSDPNARNLLIADLNTGRYIVNYAGHGATTFWAASGFYTVNDLPLMTNGNRLTIFTLLTCLNGYFVTPTIESFAEEAMKVPNNGAVAVWASSGLTTPDVQTTLASRFYGQITAANIVRIGDLVRDAKQNLNGGRDVRLSWTLFGDPAMKVR